MARQVPVEKFHCEPLADLARQLVYAPEAKRRQQLEQAERLHDELDAAGNYPFDYIAYRITGHRQTSTETVLLVGEAVRPDLRLLIDQLSRSLALPSDDPPTVTIEALAERLGVSARTIKRWRKVGLRWRWVAPADGGRPHVAFTESAVQRFVEENPQRVQRAGQFSHLSADERARLIERARRLASVTDASLHQVAAHLAKRTGRGAETIRLLLARHDREHPEAKIFQNHTGPLTPRQQRLIMRAYQRGVSAGKMARRFRKSRATIYRAINERRAAEAQRVTLNYTTTATFYREDADAVLLRPGVEAEALAASTGLSRVPVDDLPEELRPVYCQPVIDQQRQRSLLLRYNYIQFRADRARAALDRYNPRAGDLDALDELFEQRRRLRLLLFRVNLPSVLSVARRQLVGKSDPGQHTLWALLARGHELLSESIEHYDPSRSQTFGSYLTNTLMRRFATDLALTQPRGKAHRRLSGQQVLDWLAGEAQAIDVPLKKLCAAPDWPVAEAEVAG